MKPFRHILLGAAVTLGMSACTDEIVQGKTDIDSWPLPSVKLEYPTQLTHPGVVFNQADYDRWRQVALTQCEPQWSGYQLFAADRYSRADYTMNGPYECILTGQGYETNLIQLNADWAAACQNAIMFITTGQQAHADKALEIIDAYAHKMTKRANYQGGGGQLDHILAISNVGGKLVYAVEMMRHAPNTPMTDKQFQDICAMLQKVFVPDLEDYFRITEPSKMAIGNFGATAMNCYASMGILFDKPEMFQFAIERYLTGFDNGSIRYYIDAETGQCQETGRDQTHCQLGLGMISMLCENAWKQGVDLYGVYDNRLLSGYEYTARYNLGYDVPFKIMPELTGKYHWTYPDEVDQTELLTGQRAEGRRGKFSPVYERVYNHYVTRKGGAMPYVKEVLFDKKVRPEGDGSPDVAHLGFGTFLYCTEGFPAN